MKKTVSLFQFSLFAIASLVSFECFAQSPRILVPYLVGKKWGYSDTLGNIRVLAKYDTVSLFDYNGIRRHNRVIATARINGKPMIIDDAGTVLVPPKYDGINPLIDLEDFAFAIIKNGKSGVFTKGKELFPPVYDFFDVTTGVHFKVRQNGKYGLIDTKGKVVIPVMYELLQERPGNQPGFVSWEGISSGKEPVLYSVKAEQEYGASDIPTVEVLSEDVFVSAERLAQTYDEAKSAYSLDSLQVRKSAGIVYKKGKQGVFLPAERKPVYFFSNDYIIHHIKYFAPEYRNEWNKGSAAYIIASLNGKYGIINEAGSKVLPFLYDNIEERDGFFLLKKRGKLGFFIWNTLYPVIQPAYDEYEWKQYIPVNNNWNFTVFKVKKNGKPGFVGENGIPFFKD